MEIIDNGPQYDANNNYIGDLYVVDGVEIYVCYPQNSELSGNVETTVFWPGSSNVSSYRSNSLPYVLNHTKESNNSLLISIEYNKEVYTNPDKIANAINAVNNLIEKIEKDKNIEISYSSVESCSAGGVPSTNHFLSILKNSKNNNSVSLNLYDTYNHSKDYFDYPFTEEELQLMKEKNTQVTFFVRNDTKQSYKRINKVTNPDSQDGAFVNSLVTSGINTVLIYGNYLHGDILIRVAKDGWLDYQNGLIELEDIKNNEYINYRINIYEDGKWVEYKLSDLVEARKNPEKFGDRLDSLLSACNYLDSMYININHELINQIESLNSVWNTNISNTNIDYSSTSLLLPEENELLKNIDKSIIKIQGLFFKEMQKVKNAGREYLRLEKQLEKETNNLNSFLLNSENKIYSSNREKPPIINISEERKDSFSYLDKGGIE